MKKLILISGTMGVGKSTITQELAKRTENSAYLDGDWCWMINPFVVNAENKSMVINNIHYLLNSFIHNSMIETIFFCWVMDEQEIVDLLLDGINQDRIELQHFSLIATPEHLKANIQQDINAGIRTYCDIEKSISRIQKYELIQSQKIDVSNKSISEIIFNILKKI